MKRLAALAILLPIAAMGGPSPAGDWPNTFSRSSWFWRTDAAVSATHFNGDYCIPRPGSTSSAPLSCAVVTFNIERSYFTPNDIFVGTCWTRIYNVNGTWNDGTDTVVADLRFQQNGSSSDSTTTISVTADDTWVSKSFNINDPFSDVAPTANFVALSPSLNSITDANASVTDFDMIFFCDVSEVP